MENHKKVENTKPRKKDCSKCQKLKIVVVHCNHCKQYYCNDCWHTFKVHHFGYRNPKRGVYTSNRCGECAIEPLPSLAEECEEKVDLKAEDKEVEENSSMDEIEV